MHTSRQQRWAEERVEMLERQLNNLRPHSLKKQQETQRAVASYDERVRALMKEHPELQEAWDNFACLYQLAANKTVLAAAQRRRGGGCYLCYSDLERDQEDMRRSKANLEKRDAEK
jgi:hypothetical protein